MRAFIAVLIIVGGSVYAYARMLGNRFDLLAEQREELAVTTEGDISVAVIWPSDDRSFLRGVKLAVDEINQADGAPIRMADGTEYAGRFRLRFFDEPNVESGSAAARHVTRDPETLVALGHNTPSAMRALIIYNTGGVLFLAPTSLNRTLTQHGFGFVFRMAPDEGQFAAAMVEALPTLLPPKYIRVAVLYPNGAEGESSEGAGVPANGDPPATDLGREFTQFANSLLEPFGDRIRMDVVLSQAYDPDNFDSPETLAPLRQHSALYDVALILDVLPVASSLSRQLQSHLDQIGEDKVILTLDDLDWSNMDTAYADFSPALGLTFFEPVVQLVLGKVRQNIGIIASRDELGKSMSSEIWSAVGNFAQSPTQQVSLAVYRSFLPGTELFSELVSELQDKDVDLVFLAGAPEDNIRLVIQMREAGLEAPVVGDPALEPYMHELDADPAIDSVREVIQEWLDEERGQVATEGPSVRDLFLRLRSEHGYRGSEVAVRRFVAETNGGTFVASTFDVNSRNENVRAFVSAFREKYGDVEIDTLAADGYQAMQLIANAFRRSRSRSPSATAEALKLFVSEGSFENNRFSSQGELVDRPIFLKRLMPDGTIQVIETRRSTEIPK